MRVIGDFLLLFRVIMASSSTSTESLKEQGHSVSYAEGLPVAQGAVSVPYQLTSPPIRQGPDIWGCAQKEQQLEHITYKVGPRDICLLAASSTALIFIKHHGISL
jgi:hypothetical protein